MFFKKNKNSQPAATVHQSTFGVSEMSDDDLIAVTGGAANSFASSGSKNSSGSSVLGAAWSSSSAGVDIIRRSIPTVNSSLFDLLAGGQRSLRVSLKLLN